VPRAQSRTRGVQRSRKRPQRKQRAPVVRNLKRGQQVVLAAGAVAGALLSIIGFIKVFHHANPPPPVASDATISRAVVSDSEISRGAYCAGQKLAFRKACLANGSVRDLGDQWEVRLGLVGYAAGKPCCELHYTIYQVNKQGVQLNAVPGYRDVVAIDKIVPRNARGDTRIFLIWIPYAKPGLFRIAFRAFDSDGPTDTYETKTFRLDE
jgi:hypothetical protein